MTGLEAAIGNDVVDLRDPETREGASHPRFDARVFAAHERAAIAADPSPRVARWRLWAAKESAFKVARKRDARSVWSPRRFVASLDASGTGVVRHGGASYPVRVTSTDDWIHALATAPGGDPGSVALRHAVSERREGEDPSRAVRAAVLDALDPGAAGGLRIARRGRIPYLVHPSGEAELTLSHHGRFVAWATPALATGSAA